MLNQCKFVLSTERMIIGTKKSKLKTAPKDDYLCLDREIIIPVIKKHIGMMCSMFAHMSLLPNAATLRTQNLGSQHFIKLKAR